MDQRRVNELFFCDKILKERGVRVLAYHGPSTNNDKAAVWIAKPWHDADSTHKALLVCIEELPKKLCAHEPEADVRYVPASPTKETVIMVKGSESKCRHCGVKLKAKWEVVK